MSWNDGYVVDVPYTSGSYGFLGPAWLSMVAVLNGHRQLTRDLTYVELGCGYGMTSCVVAASCPEATVWACDFNPDQIDKARSVVREAGLRNCEFEEASFAELIEDGLGPDGADVVVLHGVYSWVTETNRRHLVEYLRRRLRPGGLVYVSYNVMTGWASLLGIRETMARQAATDRRRSDRAVLGALATMRQLAEDGARAFPLPPREQAAFDALGDSDPAYVAHEYLGGSFRPTMFADVAGELADAKCSYVGSCTVADVALDLRVRPELVEMVRTEPNVALRETICDLVGTVAFRRDVFRRGGSRLDEASWGRALDGLVFVSGGRVNADPPGQAVSSFGAANIDVRQREAVVELLASGSASGAEIRAQEPFRSHGNGDFALALALLVAGGYAAPGFHGADRRGSADGVNQMLVESARAGQPAGFLVAPVVTATVPVDGLVTLAIGERWGGTTLGVEALAVATLERVKTGGLPVVRDGVRLEGPPLDEAALDAARRAVELLAGPFEHLGIGTRTMASAPRENRSRRRKP